VLQLEIRLPGALDHALLDRPTDHNMQTGRQDDAIPLIPYQVTNFLVQERRYSELAAQVSARLVTDSGRDVSPFLDDSLVSAWYRNHSEERENGTRSSDEVGSWHLIRPVATVLKCRRTRIIRLRRRGGAVHERGSPPPGYHRR